MKKTPNIVNADQLIAQSGQSQCGLPDGRWVAARPLGYWSWNHRMRATWLVFTGQADALTWTGQ